MPLLLDRGSPAAWLVNLLQERNTRFIMRCDTRSGDWTALRRFIHGSAPEAHITRGAPQPPDAADRQRSPQAPTVRVVRQIAPNGQTRVHRPTGRATRPTH